ncbi:uncharacterized protein LOC116581393 [Mustela erminea]|uniref:uncharacterized protein LOC116581393 n=1 Tax=Mustela erminea TaxID=36723 RepID=UPI00138694B8|nr:uncharacterized protein LOC116581393 [Mustela erminea]
MERSQTLQEFMELIFLPARIIRLGMTMWMQNSCLLWDRLDKGRCLEITEKSVCCPTPSCPFSKQMSFSNILGCCDASSAPIQQSLEDARQGQRGERRPVGGFPRDPYKPARPYGAPQFVKRFTIHCLSEPCNTPVMGERSQPPPPPAFHRWEDGSEQSALSDAPWDERKPHLTADLLTSCPLTSLCYRCLVLRLHSSLLHGSISHVLMRTCLGPALCWALGRDRTGDHLCPLLSQKSQGLPRCLVSLGTLGKV